MYDIFTYNQNTFVQIKVIKNWGSWFIQDKDGSSMQFICDEVQEDLNLKNLKKQGVPLNKLRLFSPT